MDTFFAVISGVLIGAGGIGLLANALIGKARALVNDINWDDALAMSDAQPINYIPR